MKDLTLPVVIRTMESKGYKFFDGDNYDVNIIGIRNSNTSTDVTNKFDDVLVLTFSVEGVWYFHVWDITTDPGKYWMENPLNTKGTAILVPGQYRSSYKIRKHQGRYDAVCQKKVLPVYRDSNKDEVYDLDPETIQEGIFGINIHRSNPYHESTQVDKWSAGCQVFSHPNNFNTFMRICKKSSAIWGNSFTYTLLESKDLKF